MSRQSWFEQNRSRLGPWAPQLETFASQYDNPITFQLKVGRYIMWCLDNGHDPAQPNVGSVTEYLQTARQLNGGLYGPGSLENMRSSINRWHKWLTT